MAWSCDYIYELSVEVDEHAGDDLWEYSLDTYHAGLFTEHCDTNNDGLLTVCEIHTCIVEVENMYRTNNCPEFGNVYCENPFYCPECPDAWSCEMLY
jgi:hypothetical protein